MHDGVFTTERFLVRRWRDADLEALQSVYGDADAMQWVGEGKALTKEQCAGWFDVTRTNYEKRGYGMFAVVSKAADEVVGFCGIVHPGGQVEAEVKYAYLRKHWGLGIATEVLTGLLEYGHKTHGLRRIIATAAPANTKSHRVLLKAGMKLGAFREDEDESHKQAFHWQPANSAA